MPKKVKTGVLTFATATTKKALTFLQKPTFLPDVQDSEIVKMHFSQLNKATENIENAKKQQQ